LKCGSGPAGNFGNNTVTAKGKNYHNAIIICKNKKSDLSKKNFFGSIFYARILKWGYQQAQIKKGLKTICTVSGLNCRLF
jgi:hypothetical protein